MIGIYKITNKINGKNYIGQSMDIERRIKDHFWKSKCMKDISFNSILHQAIRKYGPDNFEWTVIEECSISNIDSLEQKYITQYNSITPNGYNILPGGQKNRLISSEANISPITHCAICGVEISSNATYCFPCSHIMQRRCEWPTRDELKTQIRNNSFLHLSKIYGISDKGICRWCSNYNLPSKRKDIRKYTDEEWKNI